MGHICCLGGLSLAWPHAGWSKWGRRNEKERGAPWSGATGCRKSAARSLASRRQKARLCLVPTMTQGAKNYKIRQPPPPSGREICKRQDSPCTEPKPSTPSPKRQKRFAPFSRGRRRHRYHFYRAISSATLPRRALFRSLLGKENFRQPCDFLICDF